MVLEMIFLPFVQKRGRKMPFKVPVRKLSMMGMNIEFIDQLVVPVYIIVQAGSNVSENIAKQIRNLLWCFL